jgi:hypothetical protein
MPAQRADRLVDLPVEHIVRLAERLQHDAIVLLDRSAFDGVDLDLAVVEAEITLVGERFRIVAVVHPAADS